MSCDGKNKSIRISALRLSALIPLDVFYSKFPSTEGLR